MRMRRGVALSCLWASHSGGEAGERSCAIWADVVQA
jgi:hypothetical protein